MPSSPSLVTGHVCVKCGRAYDAAPRFTCETCGLEGILDVRYDYEAAKKTLTREALAARPADHWRYRELLPLPGDASLPHLQVGMTPVYSAVRLAEATSLSEVFVKDEGRNPSGSFKDRASSLGVVKAKEAGAKIIACASTGNAASSLACFSAALGLESFIFVPARAPEPKVTQLLIFGANVLRVQGDYGQTWDLCQKACERYGFYNRNCAVNPYLVEGKKTAGLELGEQLGRKMPDWVAVSVGDGCTLAGVYKGLLEMVKMGIADRMPKLLGVQAEGSAAVTRVFDGDLSELEPVPEETFADSIAVGHPRNWRKAIVALKGSSGRMVNVSDDQIRAAMRELARSAAVFGEPAGAASWAGVRVALERKIIKPKERVAVLVTGSGLKDVRGAASAVTPPSDVAPDLSALDDLLRTKGLL